MTIEMTNQNTVNCIVCLKPATIFTGHVLKDGKGVFAGFCCNEHEENSQDTAGCFGDWKPEFGLANKLFKKAS